MNDCRIGRFFPSDKSKFASVSQGEYQAVHHIHKDYPALQVRNQLNVNDGKIPTIGNNPAHPSRNYAEGINIHRAGKYTPGKGYFTGTFYKESGRYSGVSEGCLLIDNSKWDEFISNFNGVSKIGVSILRQKITLPVGDIPELIYITLIDNTYYVGSKIFLK